MKYEKYFIPLLLFWVLVGFLGSTSAARSITFNDWGGDNDQLVDRRVIQEYDPDSNYVFENFTGAHSTFFGYNNFNTGQSTASYTTDPAESFDGYALYYSHVDDAEYSSWNQLKMYPGKNHTSFINLQTFEFDYLAENEPGKGLRISLIDATYSNAHFGFNDTCNSEGTSLVPHTYTRFELLKKHSDQEMSFGFYPSDGQWHHVIISFRNNLAEGRQLSIIHDNVSVSYVGAHDPLYPTNHAWQLHIAPEERYNIENNEWGRDMVIDNIAMYNTSYTHDQLVEAVTDAIEGEEPPIADPDPEPDPDTPLSGLDLGIALGNVIIILVLIGILGNITKGTRSRLNPYEKNRGNNNH